uniref:G_PROTEIN_RECEP_F1_2 domain-containing protein n=1 Tax=Panagrellus redivivus TaxID=6233 RepID=A0A7E4ZZH8_PANRE
MSLADSLPLLMSSTSSSRLGNASTSETVLNALIESTTMESLSYEYSIDDDEEPDDYVGGTLLLNLRKYARHILPIFCVVGILGNCMALLLIRTNYWLRRLTSNIYLCTLSLCSCLFLGSVLITWIDSSLGFPLYSNSELGCKTFTFLAHACDLVCVWMICWTSIDRAIVLYRPGIRKTVCSKKFARQLVIGTIIFSTILYGWCLVFAGLEESNDGSTYCGLGLDKDYKFFGYGLRDLHIFFSLLDTILCTIVPSLLIMLVNSLSIYRYRQCMKIYASGILRVRFLRLPGAQETKPAEETTTAKKFLLSQQSQVTSQVATNSSRSSHGTKIRSSDLTLSRSLLIVTSTFVLLNVPNYACRLYETVFQIEQTRWWQFLVFMTYLLYYFHHATLFYVYVFWSPQMKKQLKPTALKLLECYCFKTVPEFGHSQVSLQVYKR